MNIIKELKMSTDNNQKVKRKYTKKIKEEVKVEEPKVEEVKVEEVKVKRKYTKKVKEVEKEKPKVEVKEQKSKDEVKKVEKEVEKQVEIKEQKSDDALKYRDTPESKAEMDLIFSKLFDEDVLSNTEEHDKLMAKLKEITERPERPLSIEEKVQRYDKDVGMLKERIAKIRNETSRKDIKLKEQEEEIENLKKSIKGKDFMMKMYYFLITEFTKIVSKSPVYIPGRGFIIPVTSEEKIDEERSDIQGLYLAPTGDQVYKYSPTPINSIKNIHYPPAMDYRSKETFDIPGINLDHIDFENILNEDDDDEDEDNNFFNNNKNTINTGYFTFTTNSSSTSYDNNNSTTNNYYNFSKFNQQDEEDEDSEPLNSEDDEYGEINYSDDDN